MHIYNVTINIEEAVHNEWLEWMKEEHIPQMLKTGKFTEALMSRVLVNEEMGGITYSVQYQTESKAMLQRYYDEDASAMRKESERFKGKAVAFRTEMEVVNKQ